MPSIYDWRDGEIVNVKKIRREFWLEAVGGVAVAITAAAMVILFACA